MINKLMFNGKLASISTLFLILGLNVAITNKTQAFELTLTPVNLGWVGENGLRFQANTNYFAGDCRGEIGQCDPATDTNIQFNPGTQIRNFFVFDTTGYSFTNINSAKLRLQLPEFEVLNNVDPNYPVGSTVSGFVSDSVPPEESFQLFDVTQSNISSLNVGHTEGSLAGQNLFTDLGTGLSLSDVITINNTSGGNFVDINLNQNGINEILIGGRFAFGGAITSLDGTANDEFAFGYTNPSFNKLNPNAVDTVRRVRLVLDVGNAQSQSTPEPSALIGLIGLGGLGLFGRKKGKKSGN